MKTVQPKIDNLLIGSLGFIPLNSSAGHFSSPRLTTKFLILAAWRIAAPHIILGSPDSMRKHLAISSSVLLHLSANPFCCGVSGMVFSCRMPASKQYVLNCTERNSFALSYLSFLGVPTLRTNFFLANASHFALSNSTNTNFVYWSANTMQNRNPDSDSTLKGPITSVNTLSSFSSAWVSASLGTGVFVILANSHTLHTSASSHTVSGAFLTTSAWFKWPNRLCHFLGLSRVTFLSFMQLFLLSKVKLCPHSVHLETDRRFEE